MRQRYEVHNISSSPYTSRARLHSDILHVDIDSFAVERRLCSLLYELFSVVCLQQIKNKKFEHITSRIQDSKLSTF